MSLKNPDLIKLAPTDRKFFDIVTLMSATYSFTEELWLYPGQGAWCFITLPAKYTTEIKAISDPIKRGFGSVKVSVTVGTTTWETSIFPDSKSSSYLLPVKKEIRLKNNIQIGDRVKVSVSIVGI